MDEDFLRKRISELRLQKGVSEYRMSTDLGHSKSYIQGITSGRSLLSWSEFFYMCDYFGITPAQFFDEGLTYPELTQKAIEGLKMLEQNDLQLILSHIERLKK